MRKHWLDYTHILWQTSFIVHYIVTCWWIYEISMKPLVTFILFVLISKFYQKQFNTATIRFRSVERVTFLILNIYVKCFYDYFFGPIYSDFFQSLRDKQMKIHYKSCWYLHFGLRRKELTICHSCSWSVQTIANTCCFR